MYRKKHMAAAATLLVATGQTELGIINVNTGAASAVVTVYDDTSAVASSVIAIIDASGEGCYVYACYCMRGITVVMAGGDADITISHG